MEENINSVNYVCKTCGRAIRAKTAPKYCYFDRTTNLENISDQDSIKMGLFSLTTGLPVSFDRNLTIVEFAKDIRWCPFTGEDLMSYYKTVQGATLDDFQNKIMDRVKGE